MVGRLSFRRLVNFVVFIPLLFTGVSCLLCFEFRDRYTWTPYPPRRPYSPSSPGWVFLKRSSDRGTQLMAEVHKLLGVKPQFTPPYHTAANGRVERLHGPHKAIFRKVCHEKPREWHRYLIPALCTLRELSSDCTGFSAFEFLYGHSDQGPLTLLKDLWEDRQQKEEDRSNLQYVI